MRKLFLIIPLVFLLCFIFGCQKKAEEVAEAAKPVADVEADIAAIKGLLDEFDASLNVGDPERLVSLNYAEDAIRMPPDVPMLRGKAEILEWFKKNAELNTFQLDNVGVDAQVDGDLAYMRGTASGNITPKATGEPQEVKSKWMAAYERQADGSWKVICDIYNSDNPALVVSQPFEVEGFVEEPTQIISDDPDIAAIIALNDEWMTLYNAGDFETLVSVFYLDNPVQLPQNEPTREGKEAILAGMKESREINDEHCDSSITEDVRVSGNLAVARGTDIGTITPKEGGIVFKYNMKWLIIYERQSDGSWKCKCEIWNSNIPLPPSSS
ncbi:MAG: DUF4440 domain-containing protein [Candidatus Aminicenantes bacterium]|nr:MAG: DUF4440 domain-containing protein [Candidatus Aminicenantes bacterium]